MITKARLKTAAKFCGMETIMWVASEGDLRVNGESVWRPFAWLKSPDGIHAMTQTLRAKDYSIQMTIGREVRVSIVLRAGGGFRAEGAGDSVAEAMILAICKLAKEKK